MKIFTASLAILLMGFVGQADFNEQLDQRNYYCEMVEKGIWPAYDGDC